MKTLAKRLEDIFAAVSFAEEGDADTARAILKEEECRKISKKEQGESKPIVLAPKGI